MSLLAFEHVGKLLGRGSRECVVLRDVSLQLDAGELVAVWGRRRSGRSTLLRVAAGIEQPDTGVIRFAGRDLALPGGDALGHGIGYCRTPLRAGEGRSVLEELLVGPLARGVPRAAARADARTALERVDAGGCAELTVGELDSEEALRITLARALTMRPALLVIDEPTKGIDLLRRDEVLRLLRSLADEGIAILMTVGESPALSGADRALSLSDGELHGSVSPELASVVPLRRQASA